VKLLNNMVASCTMSIYSAMEYEALTIETTNCKALLVFLNNFIIYLKPLIKFKFTNITFFYSKINLF